MGLLHFTNAFSVWKYVGARKRRKSHPGKPNRHAQRNVPFWVVVAILFGPLVWLVWSFYTRVVEKKNPKTNPKNDLSNHEIKTPLLSHENTSIQNDSADEKPDSVIYACAPGNTSQSSIQTKSVMEEHSLSESMQQQSLTGNTSIQSFSDTEESVYNDLSSESMQHQSLTRSNSIQMHTAVESDSAIAPAHVLVSPLLNRCDLEFIPGVHPIEGGMGTVRQAMHHGVLVAVKSPKILSPMGPRFKSSFMKEINIIKCAQHYACVVLRGVVIDDESVMLVTEWMEGGSLNDALEHHEERRLSPNVRKSLASSLMDCSICTPSRSFTGTLRVTTYC